MNHSIRTEDTREDPRKDTCTNNYLEDCNRCQSPHELSLFSLQNKSHLPIIVNVLLNVITLPMELDTGAAMSTFSEDTKHALFPDKQLRSSDAVLRTYTSETVPVIVAVPKKDGKLGICGDYKVTINPSMKAVQHPLPTLSTCSQPYQEEKFSPILTYRMHTNRCLLIILARNWSQLTLIIGCITTILSCFSSSIISACNGYDTGRSHQCYLLH